LLERDQVTVQTWNSFSPDTDTDPGYDARNPAFLGSGSDSTHADDCLKVQVS
jgi:hypothetical protein